MSQPYQYTVSLCAVFQNEARFLKEWIEFHLLVGFQHFYLTNDCSTDNYLEILTPYIKKGLVDLNQSQTTLCQDLGQHLPKQVAEYNRFLSQMKKESEWVAVLDLDEFLYCPDGRDIKTFLKDYNNDLIGAIYVFWQTYGTSNVAEIPKNKLITETLIMKADEQYEHNKYGKSIVKTNKCKMIGLHVHNTIPETNHVTSDHKPFKIYYKSRDVMDNNTVDVSKIRINHYWTGDDKYWQQVKLPRLQKKAGTLNPPATSRLPFLNKVKDTSITQYSRKLRKKMGF